MESPNASDIPIDIDFTWEITKFTDSEAHIQLYFQVPESVSSGSSEPDNVVITFWAGDLFQAENGKQVRPGLTITAPVTRQVSVEDAIKYREYGRIASYSCLCFLILGFIYASSLNADTLPIWASYDILVLLSHLPMLNVAMPGSSAILLTEMAQTFRFNFIPINHWLGSALDLTIADDKPFNNLFLQSGYESSSLLMNLSTIMLLFIFALIAQLGAKFINCSYATMPKSP